MGSNLAGPELRAAVAEKVMGFKRYTYPHRPEFYILIHEHELLNWTGVIPAPDGARPAGDYLRDVPNYPENIRAAWLVMEKLLSHPDKSIDFALALLARVREAEPHLYEINNTELFLVKVLRHLNPESISNAALEAIGYQQPKGE